MEEVYLVIHILASIWYLATDVSNISDPITILQFSSSLLATFVPVIFVSKSYAEVFSSSPQIEWSIVGARTIVELASISLGITGSVLSFKSSQKEFQMISEE